MYVLRKKNGIVEQLLMAFVAEKTSSPFDTPRVLFKDGIPLLTGSILGASEEAFGDIVVFRCVGATSDCRLRVTAAAI